MDVAYCTVRDYYMCIANIEVWPSREKKNPTPIYDSNCVIKPIKVRLIAVNIITS